MRARSIALLGAIVAGSCACSVRAAAILVPDGSFESDSTGINVAPSPTYWTIDNAIFEGVGPYQTALPGVAEDGNQFYSSSVFRSSFPTQNLKTAASLGTYQAGTVYTLTVALARPTSGWTQPGINGTAGINFLAGGAAAGTSASIAEGLLPDGQTATNWTDLIATANTAVDPSLIGKSIGVQLSNNYIDNIQTWGQAYFDNVRVDATPLPEPASLSLALLGLSAISLRRRAR